MQVRPTAWVPLKKGLCEKNRLPERHGKLACAEQFRTGAFVEEQVGSLWVREELDDVEALVASLHENRLRATAEFAEEVRCFEYIGIHGNNPIIQNLEMKQVKAWITRNLGWESCEKIVKSKLPIGGLLQ